MWGIAFIFRRLLSCPLALTDTAPGQTTASPARSNTYRIKSSTMPMGKPTWPNSSKPSSLNSLTWANCSPKSLSNKKKSIQNSGPPIGQAQEHLHNKGEAPRLYHSIFGMITVERRKYYSQETGSYYPLDAQLNLPNATSRELLG